MPNTKKSTSDVSADTSALDKKHRKRAPSLLDGILDGEDLSAAASNHSGGFGILCNDPSGLCLSATGSFLTDNNNNNTAGGSGGGYVCLDDSVQSGVYTSLTKLAAKLYPGPAAITAPAAVANAAPLITIEREESNFLVKEYDGHAIVVKVPAASAANPNDTNNNNNATATSIGDNGGGEETTTATAEGTPTPTTANEAVAASTGSS